MAKNNDTSDQLHQYSFPWLYSPLSRMGDGHRVTTKEGGNGFDMRMEAKGRPPMTLVGNGGGVEEIGDTAKEEKVMD